MASRSRLWHRELDTLSTGIRTREYLTVHRNVDIIIKSLADRIDPGLFAQKLHEAGLVSVYWRVCAAYEFTASDRVHDMIFSVQIHINRESSKYDVFMRILKDVHPNLAERLTKYFSKFTTHICCMLLLFTSNTHSHGPKAQCTQGSNRCM